MPLCDSDGDDFETRPTQSSQQISGFPQGQSQFGAGSQRSNLPSSQQPLPAQQHNVRHPEAVVTGGGGLDSSPNLFDQVFGPDITALANSSNKRSSLQEVDERQALQPLGGHNAVEGQATKRFQHTLPAFPSSVIPPPPSGFRLSLSPWAIWRASCPCRSNACTVGLAIVTSHCRELPSALGIHEERLPARPWGCFGSSFEPEPLGGIASKLLCKACSKHLHCGLCDFNERLSSHRHQLLV
jgi:hypothetical protein